MEVSSEQVDALVSRMGSLCEAIERSQEARELECEPLTRDEAAKFLKVHTDTVYRWAKEGLIAYSKLGDGERAEMRFKLEDLKEFGFERRRVPSKGYDL